jgi:5-methylcytosine-specific restriction endonuclease McrA
MTFPQRRLHIDHIVPWSKGGETALENLETLCSECNLGKSNLLPTAG